MLIKDNKNKKYLIILGIIAFVVAIIFLISKLIDKDKIVYEEKIYYINLIGSTNITMYQGDIFVEPGYKGIDDEGNDLTQEVVVSTNINSNEIGNYKISYTLGNITKERNVKVIDKPTGATYIHLYGDVNVFLYVGEKYDEKGYEVIDTVDGNSLKDKVIVNSNVNTSKEGIYKVIYSVTNTSGITTSKVRTVIVMDRNLSLIPSPNEVTNGNVTINIYARDELFDYLVLPNNMKETKSVSTYEVSNNGTYKFIMYNNKGESREKSIEITNIDREVPSGSCEGYYGSGISQITIKAKDNVGISKYEIDGTSYTSTSIKLNKEVSSVNITIYDKAGNTKNISCTLEDKRPTPSSAKPSSSKPSYDLSDGNVNNIKPEYKSIAKTKNVSVNYFKSSNSSEFSYWLYLPDKVTKNLPIIIFLHGIGERGNDYKNNSEKAIAWGPIHEVLKHNLTYNAIIVQPQAQSYGGHNYNVKEYSELVSAIAKEFQANEKKISIIGFSHGCVGVMEWMYGTGNELFSSVVVVGCDPVYTPKKYINTPTWALVGANTVGDQTYPRLSTFVDDINSKGGNARFTRITKYPHHNIFSDEYSILRDDELNIVDWMLSFSK